MRTAMMFLAFALIGAPACKKKPAEAPAGSGSGSAMGSAMGSGSAEGSGSAMAGSGSAEGSDGSAGSAEGSAGSAAEGSGSAADATQMQHKAGMCPSTVYGSTTTAAVKGKEVIVTITAKDKAAIASIQKRADESVKGKEGAKTPAAEHTQKGVHGGTAGICPIYVPEGATAKVKHEKAGVMVMITPKEKPDDLKKDIDDRITKAEAWVKDNVKPGEKGMGAVGGGKGDEGNNHSGKGDGGGKGHKGGGGGTGGGTGGGGGKGTGGGGSGKAG